MKIITVSGKSGSGKTFIALQINKKLNATYINIDDISHLVLKQADVKFKLKQYFGEEIFFNHQIDTKKLGKIVFNDKDKLVYLNNVCQEKMEQMIDQQINGKNFIILDYALLPKMKYFDNSIKILIKADDMVRKQRIIKRDNINEEYFLLRDNNALNYDNYNFDIVIENSLSYNEKNLFKKLHNLGVNL